MENKWLLGAFSGILAGLVSGLLGIVLTGLGITKANFPTILATVIRPSDTTTTLALGWLAHLALAGLVGTVFVYLFRWSNQKFALIKGLAFGVILWALGLGLAIIEPNVTALHTLSSVGYLALNIFFGFSLAVFVELLQKERRPLT